MPESCADLKCPNSHLAIASKKPRCGQDLVIARINELRKVSLHGACSFDRMGGSLLVRGAEREGQKQDMEERFRFIPKEIETHYLQGRESQRLSGDRGELERLRTQAILGRSLPAAPAVVFDVGGAAGVYAFPLAKQGYLVHLIDRLNFTWSKQDPMRLPRASRWAPSCEATLATWTSPRAVLT